MLKTSTQLINQCREQISEVSPKEAERRSASACLIDVREPAEFQQQHIGGAINIPRGILEMELEKRYSGDELLNTEFFLYCRSGGRSALAVHSLQQLGLTRVHSVAGGIMAWSEA